MNIRRKVDDLVDRIEKAEFNQARDEYLDVWEYIGANNSSSNRLYDAVNDELSRRKVDRMIAKKEGA